MFIFHISADGLATAYAQTVMGKLKMAQPTEMNYKEIAEKIIGLKNADLEFREKLIQSGQLGEGYNEEMANLHSRNARILDEIIDTIGYPTILTPNFKPV